MVLRRSQKDRFAARILVGERRADDGEVGGLSPARIEDDFGEQAAKRLTEALPGPVDLVFSGDTLFEGTVGRTDLPGGSGRDLMGSIVDKILVLDDDTVVLPGHGNPTTVGAERRGNPFLEGLSS